MIPAFAGGGGERAVENRADARARRAALLPFSISGYIGFASGLGHLIVGGSSLEEVEIGVAIDGDEAFFALNGDDKAA